MLALLVVVPLLLVVLLNLPFKRGLMNGLAFWLGLGIALFQGLAVICPHFPVWASESTQISDLLKLGTQIDNWSRIMFLAISVVSLCSFMVCRYMMGSDDRRFVFANLLILAMAGMNGIVLCHDIFSLYLFIELSSVVSFILISFDLGKNSLEGAFKYILLSAFATTLLLSAVAIFIMFTGSSSFASIATAISTNIHHHAMLLAIAAFLCGLFIKAGLMPFHAWLPDAYSEAPAPASVLLAGIVTKTTGVYALIRIVISVFGWNTKIQLVLLAVGAISLLVAALMALGQNDFKRMLAYSSISQVGYIILGLAVGGTPGIAGPLGLAGAFFHLFNHSIFKTLLFINASAVEKETGTRNMDELAGVANQMPITGATSVIALLSTAGIPPLSGFWSKLMIIVAVWKAGFVVYACVAILGSLITLSYFLRLQRKVFYGQTAPDLQNLKEANIWATFPSILLALITLGLGLAMPWLFRSFLVPIGSFL